MLDFRLAALGIGLCSRTTERWRGSAFIPQKVRDVKGRNPQ